jgi:hypothetical protein
MRIFILVLTALGVVQAPLHAQLPTITNQPTSRALWAGGNITFSVGISGTGPFTYQWQCNTTNLPNGIITTVAGNGTKGYSGDGGNATNASLQSPFGVAVDALGNLFIADTFNHRIRKVDNYGIITTVAGNGTQSYFGDSGAATNAGLIEPTGVAVDAAGNLFIADRFNCRIRRVDTNGIIATVAGNGGYGYSGDDGAATNASLRQPWDVTVDSCGNLFIADDGNERIRKVDTNNIIATVAGNGTNSVSGDAGAATNAALSNPVGVAVDASGNLLIADNGNNRILPQGSSIRKVSTNGIITTVAGNGTNSYSGDGGAATNAGLYNPTDVTLDSYGNLFIADQGNNRVRKVDTNGIITTVAGNGTTGYSGDGGAATNASLYNPISVAVDAAGNLFVTDDVNERIRKITNTQGPALALNNVNAANAGSYQVVVTGSGGSVTSSVANLIVVTAPLIYQTTLNSNSSVSLNFVCQPGSTNMVLCATNLSPPVFWQSLSTNIAGADGNWQFTDANAANFQTRFYRSLTQ